MVAECGGNFASREYLTMSGNTWLSQLGEKMPLASGGERPVMLNLIECTQQHSTTKNYPAPEANNATEEIWDNT